MDGLEWVVYLAGVATGWFAKVVMGSVNYVQRVREKGKLPPGY